MHVLEKQVSAQGREAEVLTIQAEQRLAEVRARGWLAKQTAVRFELVTNDGQQRPLSSALSCVHSFACTHLSAHPPTHPPTTPNHHRCKCALTTGSSGCWRRRQR